MNEQQINIELSALDFESIHKIKHILIKSLTMSDNDNNLIAIEKIDSYTSLKTIG